MRKNPGKYVIEMYDKYGHKVKKKTKNNYTKSLIMARKWEKKDKGNNVVISRIMYNTIFSNYKWDKK